MESNKFKTPSELRWEITNSEQKEKEKNKLKMIFKLLPLFFVFSLLYVFSQIGEISTWKMMLSSLGVFWAFMIVVLVIFWFFINFIISYRKRTYYLNDLGFEISKGQKKKFYKWSEFKCFYIYSYVRSDIDNKSFKGNRLMSKGQRKALLQDLNGLEKVNGRLYYLEKKQAGILNRLYKTFILIYTEADNDKLVEKKLSNHISEKTMTATTDMGMAFFKYR